MSYDTGAERQQQVVRNSAQPIVQQRWLILLFLKHYYPILIFLRYLYI